MVRNSALITDHARCILGKISGQYKEFLNV